MTNTNLDLQKMGLSPLTEFEMQEIEGGNIFKAIGHAVAAAANFVANVAESVYYTFVGDPSKTH